MEIVVEYTLVTSMLACLLTVELAGKIIKQDARFKWVSCLMGSVISLIYPLFHLSAFLKVLVLIFSLTITTIISFKYSTFSTFLRDFALIFVIICVFGGMCEAVKNIVGDFSLFIVCVILLAAYIVVKSIYKSIDKANKIKQFTFVLKIVDEGKEIVEEGYLDSGNVLIDNVTKKPIILVTFEVFRKLYSVNYVNAITKNYDYRDFKNGHFVQINSVGGRGKMLVFSVDELHVGKDKSFKDAMLGLSFSGFEKSFGKNVLLNCEMI